MTLEFLFFIDRRKNSAFDTAFDFCRLFTDYLLFFRKIYVLASVHIDIGVKEGKATDLKFGTAL